jgi:uncharacterized protein (UPF0332 family)
MKEEIRTLISYRLERAFESLEEAKILLNMGHFNTFVNRLYYACFYSVSALLLSRGLSSAKHSGIRSLFHQNFIKPGLISGDLGRVYDKLFDNRQKGDYADLVWFDTDEVTEWYDETKMFVGEIEKIINKEME